jgi:hypothetical protein
MDKYGKGRFIWDCTDEQKRNRAERARRFENKVGVVMCTLFLVAYVLAFASRSL